MSHEFFKNFGIHASQLLGEMSLWNFGERIAGPLITVRIRTSMNSAIVVHHAVWKSTYFQSIYIYISFSSLNPLSLSHSLSLSRTRFLTFFSFFFFLCKIAYTKIMTREKIKMNEQPQFVRSYSNEFFQAEQVQRETRVSQRRPVFIQSRLQWFSPADDSLYDVLYNQRYIHRRFPNRSW